MFAHVCTCTRVRIGLRCGGCGFVWFPALPVVTCQRMMPYLLLIETGTGDYDTPIMAFNVPGKWAPVDKGGPGMVFVTREEKHISLSGLTVCFRGQKQGWAWSLLKKIITCREVLGLSKVLCCLTMKVGGQGTKPER